MTGLEEHEGVDKRRVMQDRKLNAEALNLTGDPQDIVYNRNEDGFIVCPICPQVFGFRSSYRNHLEKHTPDPVNRPLKCDFCPYYSNNKIGISNHARCHMDALPLITVPVPQEIKEENAANRVVKEERASSLITTAQGEIMQPSSPGMTTRASLSNMTLFRNQTDPNKFECTKCPYKTDRAQKLLVHLEFHGRSAKNTIPCDYCDFHASRHGQMTRHLKVHENFEMGLDYIVYEWENMYNESSENIEEDTNVIGTYETNVGDTYETNVEDTHGNENSQEVASDSIYINPNATFACDMCPYKVNRADNLQRHMVGHKPSPDKPFKCSACPFYSVSMQGIVRHAKIHEDLEGLDEQNEGLEEGNEENMEQEENEKYIHTVPQREPRDYNCDKCPQKLNSLNALTYHMEGHGGDPSRTVECSLCSYRAKNKFSLGQHFRCHKEEVDKNALAKKLKQEEVPIPQADEATPGPSSKDAILTVPANRSASSKSGKIYASQYCPATFPYGGMYSCQN